MAERRFGPPHAERRRGPLPRRDSLRALVPAPQREHHRTLVGEEEMATGREVLEHAFRETAKGNGRPFVDMLADDVESRLMPKSQRDEARLSLSQPLLLDIRDEGRESGSHCRILRHGAR
jgi:hypothetical protein